MSAAGPYAYAWEARAPAGAPDRDQLAGERMPVLLERRPRPHAAHRLRRWRPDRGRVPVRQPPLPGCGAMTTSPTALPTAPGHPDVDVQVSGVVGVRPRDGLSRGCDRPHTDLARRISGGIGLVGPIPRTGRRDSNSARCSRRGRLGFAAARWMLPLAPFTPLLAGRSRRRGSVRIPKRRAARLRGRHRTRQ